MRTAQVFLICVLVAFVALGVVRAVSSREIDDVTPGIACEPHLLQQSDVLWVIPLYKNESIAEDKSWCDSILALNKTLGLHGVHHTYKEFSKERDDTYLQEGIDAFSQCFGSAPIQFKAPQIALNASNSDLIERHGMTIHGKWNQLFRKVYHCSDTGMFPNWLIRIF